MNRCPKCSTELKEDAAKCIVCGSTIADEFAETVVQPPDEVQDHTPTKLAETKVQGDVHITTSDGSRFVSGTVLAGRYRIVALIGRGGMGEVYKAEDLELDQIVALKFLPEKLAKNEDLIKRFRGEVRTARQVAHPNVCKVFDIGEVEGLYYLSMEFIDGDDLSMLLKRIGRFPSDKAVEISRQICMGLSAVHNAGILHRDLKPANIIIDSNGKARITDFGIAGLEAEVQGAEARIGTPAYMSPEQVSGKELTRKSDIYSLGLLLYEIFTGKQAFEAETIPILLNKHKTENPTTPSEIVTGIDPLVEDVIKSCLEKDPDDRPETALQVAMTLPGGNPLQAAMEAGETPTPEMIAAAPSKGTLKPLIALALFLGFVVFFSSMTYLRSIYASNAYAPLEKSSEVLADRSKEIIKRLGYTEKPQGTNYKFVDEFSFEEFIKEQDNPREWFEKLRGGQPTIYFFRYRQSPEYLQPTDNGPHVSKDDPPMTLPGMVTVETDVTGRLIQFVAVPPDAKSTNTKSLGTDWTKLFDEAGLEKPALKEIEIEHTPPVLADEMAAWQGTMAGHPDIPVRIEAAGFRGRPVYFKIVPSWKEPEGSAQKKVEEEESATPFFIFLMSLLLLSLLGSLLLVRYNLRNGRGDLKGAVKTASVCLCIWVVSSLLVAETPPTFDGSLGILFWSLAYGLLNSSFVFLFYLAVEPLVRRRWPEVLISWNRLIMGGWRNPMVGRDILVGIFSVSFLNLLEFALGYFESTLDPKTFGNLIDIPSAQGLNGIAETLSQILDDLFSMFILSFWFLFILLVISLVLKKKWISAFVAAMTLIIPTVLLDLSQNAWSESVFEFIAWLVVFFLLVRFGLVALMALALFSGSFMVTFDSSSFYFSTTLISCVFYFAIAIYAFYIALAGQPLFGKGFLEEN